MLAYSSESYCVTACEDIPGVSKVYNYYDTTVTYSKYYFTHIGQTSNPSCARMFICCVLLTRLECQGATAWTWCESCKSSTTAGPMPVTTYECHECTYDNKRFLTPPYPGGAVAKDMFDCSGTGPGGGMTLLSIHMMISESRTFNYCAIINLLLAPGFNIRLRCVQWIDRYHTIRQDVEPYQCCTELRNTV
jgi:hypothetical protein